MTEQEKKLLEQQNTQRNTQQQPTTAAPELKPTTAQAAPTVSDEAYDNAIATLKANAKPVYAGTYDAQIEDAYNQIVNRDKFRYSVNEDALYQMYKDNYANLGRMAMKDTMGQAAALTGGYGSSYGQSVGQQAYDSYLQQLNNIVPELQDRAYGYYQDEGDRLLNQYTLLGDMRDREYNAYEDELARWTADRDYAKNSLMDMINTTGYTPTAEEIAAAGMTQEQVNLLLKAWKVQNPGLYNQLYGSTGSRGGSRGGGGGGGGGGSDLADLYYQYYDEQLTLDSSRVSNVSSRYLETYLSDRASNAAIAKLKNDGYTDEEIKKALEQA